MTGAPTLADLGQPRGATTIGGVSMVVRHLSLGTVADLVAAHPTLSAVLLKFDLEALGAAGRQALVALLVEVTGEQAAVVDRLPAWWQRAIIAEALDRSYGPPPKGETAPPGEDGAAASP